MAKTLKKKAFNQMLYISIGSAIGLLILFLTLYNAFNKVSKQNDINVGESNSSEQVEQANSPVGKSVEEAESETKADNQLNNEEQNQGVSVSLANDENSSNSSAQNEINDLDKKDESQGTAQQNENVDVQANAGESTEDEEDESIPEPTFCMPVEGEIVKHYGKEKLIYSETLKEWTVHLGIDIKANKTTIVKSSSKGTVKSIKNDPRYGLTVVIEHDKGFSSVYANLLTAEFVTVGEKVEAGQTIGTVGNSATFEILDEPHLHFEILKDGNSIDPEMYIK